MTPKGGNDMEKIKISISSHTLDIINKDIGAFEILKTDGSPNKNDFLNRLIKNYYEEYTALYQEQLTKMEKVINKYVHIDDYDKNTLSNELLKIYKDSIVERYISDETVVISLKPTKETTPIIEYLENYIIKSQSISSFFRQMFDSYISKVQIFRERIIFKDLYETLTKSIDRNKQVYISLKNEKANDFIGTLYSISPSDEEMYNYCLFDNQGYIYTNRLCRIKNAKIINKEGKVNEDNLPLFDFMIKNGPQYVYSPLDLEIVKVYLTTQGQKLFKRIYLYRPKPIRIDGDYYYFQCSNSQLLHYFKRFGRDAIIIEPEYLKDKLLNYYKDSYFKYQRTSDQLNKKAKC